MKPTEYLASVQQLFIEVEHWASRNDLMTRHGSTELNEEAYGVYQINTLKVCTKADKQLAEFVPIGASIIAAKGRVDLVGIIDSVILVKWDKGGPSITTIVDEGGIQHNATKPIYRNVGDAGWYWVESRKLSRAHRFDERLFYELLRSVSDYECHS